MNSDEEAAGPTLPKGVLRPKGRGWAGEDLELRRSVKEHNGKMSTGTVRNAAVDKFEFYNTEVGSGYQAKHVVRQRQGGVAKVQIIDMSNKSVNNKESLKKHKREKIDKKEKETEDRRKHKKSRSKKEKDEYDTQNEEGNHKHDLLSQMLNCDAMCEFKLEIAKILGSDR